MQGRLVIALSGINTPCPVLDALLPVLPAPLPAPTPLVPNCLPCCLPCCPQDLWGKVMWVWDLPDVQKLRLTISMANFR